MKTPLSRREFLERTTPLAGVLLASGLALPAQARINPAPVAGVGGGRKLGLAVVGLGNFASFALSRIQRSTRTRITALVSGDATKAARVAADYGVASGHVYSYENFDRIADDPTIEAVYLCVPVGLHAEFAIRAMRAGKHVLSEKTLAATSAQAVEMLRVARESRRHLLIAYRTYFGPAYATLQEIVADGRYGRLAHIDVHKGFPMAHTAPGHWRFQRTLAGGGSLVDVGVYSVQAARLFARAMPTSVTAQVFSDPDDARYREVEDNIVFTLKFPDGTVASGSSSWSYQLQNRLRLGFTGAWVDLEPASPAIGQKLRIGLEGPRRIEEPPLEQVDQMPLMFDHLAAVVHDGAPAIVPASEGLKDLLVIEAIYAAAARGQETAVAALPAIHAADNHT